ncbi:MAG: hypothetical protein V4456_16290 [Bacteroidota bacterium]
MWKNSFNADGTVFKENAAWITNRGILVLPNDKNKNNLSFSNAYKITRGASGKLFVNFNKVQLLILGHVHTHPNGWIDYPSNPNDYAMVTFMGGKPIYTIGPNSVFSGTIINGINTPTLVGPTSELLNGNLLLK